MINSVHLENFKNFRDATLNLGPFTVIVGTNASGKSNLRDAFRFLNGVGRDYSLADIVGEKFVDGVLQWKGIRGGSREIATFGAKRFAIEVVSDSPFDSKDQFKFRAEVAVTFGSRPLRIVSEIFEIGSDLVYRARAPFDPTIHGYSLSLDVEGFEVDVPTTNNKGAFIASDTPALSQVSELMIIGDFPDFCSSFYRQSLRSMRFLDLVPETMKNPSIPGQPLGDRGENLSSALLAICENESHKQAMMEWVRQLTPVDVVDFEFPADQAGRVLVALKEANGNVTSAYSASDGTLRFLALIAALMSPDAAKFYFLEEIDNGIHPTRLKLLIELIEQQTKKGKIQVVVTTHSPQFLTLLSPESREHAHLVYRHEHEPDAQLKRIMDIPTARDVLERHTLGRLLETGWFENTMDFATEAAGD